MYTEMQLIFCHNKTEHKHTNTQMKAGEISQATFDFCVFLIEIENRANKKKRERTLCPGRRRRNPVQHSSHCLYENASVPFNNNKRKKRKKEKYFT